MTDLNKLRELAKAATPEVGKACDYCSEYAEREGHVNFETADLFIGSDRPKEDSAYYAAVSPSSTLAILDRLEAAERDAKRYRWLLTQSWFLSEVDWHMKYADVDTESVIDAAMQEQSK